MGVARVCQRGGEADALGQRDLGCPLPTTKNPGTGSGFVCKSSVRLSSLCDVLSTPHPQDRAIQRVHVLSKGHNAHPIFAFSVVMHIDHAVVHQNGHAHGAHVRFSLRRSLVRTKV